MPAGPARWVPFRRWRAENGLWQLLVIDALVKVVAVMPEAVETQPQRQASWLNFNSDGRPHPVVNIAAVLVFVVGIVAFALGLIVKTHFPATVLGIAAFGGGLAVQLNSATREQRIVIITGIIAAFVGMALGIGHGGFS
jgi:hypothetical protein